MGIRSPANADVAQTVRVDGRGAGAQPDGDHEPLAHGNRKHHPIDASRRLARLAGTDALYDALRVAVSGSNPAELASEIARLVAMSETRDARRADRIRGAADVLEEVVRQLRQMTAGKSRT